MVVALIGFPFNFFQEAFHLCAGSLHILGQRYRGEVLFLRHGGLLDEQPHMRKLLQAVVELDGFEGYQKLMEDVGVGGKAVRDEPLSQEFEPFDEGQNLVG